MSFIVQKYGGSSLANLGCVQEVAKRIAKAYHRGHKVVVVVSASKGTTDTLIARAQKMTESPSRRELDALLTVGEQETAALLGIALNALQIPACTLNSAQIPLYVNGEHGDGDITHVETSNILRLINKEEVVIVTGFQGLCAQTGFFMTLGRGGSDLTAIALAAALKADQCQIFTDVSGVYTIDPNRMPMARKIGLLCHETMYWMAFHGAKVMQPKAVAYAQSHGVSFEVASSSSEDPGTLICPNDDKAQPHPTAIVFRSLRAKSSAPQMELTLITHDVPTHVSFLQKQFNAWKGSCLSTNCWEIHPYGISILLQEAVFSEILPDLANELDLVDKAPLEAFYA